MFNWINIQIKIEKTLNEMKTSSNLSVMRIQSRDCFDNKAEHRILR